MTDDDGVIAAARVVLEIREIAEQMARPGRERPFSARELAYARSKRDPERRLAARLAAKRAAVQLLGEGLEPADVEIVRGAGGPPRVSLSPRALQKLRALGGRRVLVSLTHGRSHAAAAVLLARDG